MAAANSSGGVMGKMISLQSIAVAAAATGLPAADEAKLFRFTLRLSFIAGGNRRPDRAGLCLSVFWMVGLRKGTAS